MTAAQAVLLAGIFLPPVILLAVGHAYRHRSTTVRGAFWGGVLGYGVGVVVTAAALLAPTVGWTGGSPLRALLIHGTLLAASALGMAVGGALAALRHGSAVR